MIERILIGRRLCSVLASVVAIGALLAVLVPSASAHTGLRNSAPAHDAQVAEAPTTIVLQFSGTVVVAADGIKVFGPDGSRVDTGDPSPKKSDRITQEIRDGGDGVYGVAYRVSSEDGHVVPGVISFTVGSTTDANSANAARSASQDAAKTDATVEAIFSIARGVEIIALLIAAGGGIFACIIAPGWRPRWLVTSMLLVLVAYAVSFVSNAALVSGADVNHLFDVQQLRDSRSTPFAFSLEIRAVIAVVALAPAALLSFGSRQLPRGARWVLALVFTCTAASLSLTGHAVTSTPMWLRLPADALHVVAAAIWLGGLIQLAYMASQAATRATEVARFSRFAFGSVVVIVATGVISTVVELGMPPQDLIASRYGRLICAKLILVLAALPLAWNNQQAFLPVLTSRPADAPRMLRQYVLRETVTIIIVVCLTVWLIATPQP